MDFDTIVERVVKSIGLSTAVLKAKIEDKVRELDELVSLDGAAHIVANELGVSLIDNDASQDFVNIKNLVGGLRNVIVLGRVTDVYPISTFEKDGKKLQVGSLSLNDGTGFVRVVFWDDSINIFKNINVNDVIKIINAYVRENKFGKLELHISFRTKVRINPEDVDPKTIPTISGVQHKTENIDLVEIKRDTFIKCMGAIVQIYKRNIFFSVCPECGKSVKSDEGIFMCKEHGKIIPNRKMFISFVIDDGTNNVRCTSFGRDAEKILGLSTSEAISIADANEDSSAPIEQTKDSILGKEIIIYGKATFNDFSNSIEIITNKIIEPIDFNLELNRISKEVNYGDTN